MSISERDRDALRKRDSRHVDRVVQVPTLPEEKLTAQQVQHEYLRIMGDYLDAKEVIKAKRNKKLAVLREKCPHQDIDKDGPGLPWCCDCESTLGVAIKASTPIPDDPDGLHEVEVVLGPGIDAPKYTRRLLLHVYRATFGLRRPNGARASARSPP